MSVSVRNQTIQPSYRTRVIVAVLLGICVASLATSYVVFTSKAFRFEFGGLHFNPATPQFLVDLRLANLQGALIECVRALFFLSIAYYYFGSRFRNEFRILFCLSDAPHPARSHRHYYRALAVIGILITAFVIVNHHLHVGPDELKRHFLEHIEQGVVDSQVDVAKEDHYTAYVRPYIWYLPYSVVLYIILVVPFFVIGAFGIERDWRELRTLRARLEDGMRSTTINAPAFLEIYKRFFREYVGFCGKYAHFVFLLCLAVSFESYVGQYTLSVAGANWAIIGYALGGIFVVSVLMALVLYLQAFERSYDWIRAHGGDFELFTEDFCPGRLVKHLLKTYTFVFWGLFLLGGCVPFVRILVGLLP